MNLPNITFLSELSRVCLLLNARRPRGLFAMPVLCRGRVYISLIYHDGDEAQMLEMGQDGPCCYHLTAQSDALRRGWLVTAHDDELADMLDEYVEEL